MVADNKQELHALEAARVIVDELVLQFDQSRDEAYDHIRSDVGSKFEARVRKAHEYLNKVENQAPFFAAEFERTDFRDEG